MSTYTSNITNEIYFLNDGNIAQTLSDNIEYNPIPSLSLLNTINDVLTQKINNDISVINSELSTDNTFITGIKQVSGKITQLKSSKIKDDYIDDESISKSKI
jgi:hypothetical protein